MPAGVFQLERMWSLRAHAFLRLSGSSCFQHASQHGGGAAGKMLVSEYARHSLALSSVQLSLAGECGTSVLFVFNGLLPSPCIFKTEQPSTCIANDLFCYNPS